MPSSRPTERSSQPTNTLVTRITELVQACFTGFSIETHEPGEAVLDPTQLIRVRWSAGESIFLTLTP